MLKYLFLLPFFLFQFDSILFSQSTQFNELSKLSQASNFNIKNFNSQNTYISSIDGLNIYSGHSTNMYRPTTHNMFGENIQSSFFQDTNNDVWFSTYEALHVYHPITDSLDFFFMISESGDTIKNEYRIIGTIDDTLWTIAGTKVYLFDMIKKEQLAEIDVDLYLWYRPCMFRSENGYYIYSIDYQNARIDFLNNTLKPVNKVTSEIDGSFVKVLGNGNPMFCSSDGKMVELDKNSGEVVFEKRIGNSAIGFCDLNSNELLISNSIDSLLVYNVLERKVSRVIIPGNKQTGQKFSNLIIPFVDQDSTLWIGEEGEGVFFTSLKKRKFDSWLTKPGNADEYSITRIIDIPNSKNYLVLTRSNGMLQVSNRGKILIRYREIGQSRSNTVLSGCFISDNEFLFNNRDNLFILNMVSNTILEIKNTVPNQNFFWMDIQKLSNGKIVGSNYTSRFKEIVISDGQYEVFDNNNLNKNKEDISHIKKDKFNRLFASLNESKIAYLFYNPKSKEHELKGIINLKGGCRSVLNTSNKNKVYISNTRGLFLVNLNNFSFEQIIDEQKNLLQTVYCVYDDEVGNLWTSTNTGIVSYDPSTNNSHQFSKADGVQELEFNSNAYLKNADGSILFGGVNGINYFHPKDIKLMDHEAPIYISGYKINDVDSDIAGVPNYLENLVLSYKENTLTFQFHGVDHSDPDAVRVKYQMLGVDEDYVASESQASLARYANLPAGDYQFSMLAANSDGIWGKTPRVVDITITPPFWQTWWFRSLSLVVIGGLFYYSIRSFYSRKLKRKNLEIREKNLIIEKQNALQLERTRIASEMHDDLGGGLTSIKFLSQKLLRKIDGEGNKQQAQKIMNQAQNLTGNMSEIIWAMNSGFDNLDSLIAYTRHFVFDTFEDHNIEVQFNIEGETKDVPLTGERRRNIFLIVKEAVHNIIKHANCSQVDINFAVIDDQVILEIKDNGVGLKEGSESIGNGLRNIAKRVKDMEGEHTIDTKVGTSISCSIPLISNVV